MSKLSYREAVHKATMQVFNDFPEDKPNGNDKPSIGTKRMVSHVLFNMMVNGEVHIMSERIRNYTWKSLSRFAHGCVNDQWMKDSRYTWNTVMKTSPVLSSDYGRGKSKTIMPVIAAMEEDPVFKCEGEIEDRWIKDECEEMNGLDPVSTLNPDGKSRRCECGARHTAFPNHHLSYCPMKEW